MIRPCVGWLIAGAWIAFSQVQAQPLRMMADTKARLLQLGLYPAEKTGPEALATLIRTEGPRWKEIVREAGIRAN